MHLDSYWAAECEWALNNFALPCILTLIRSSFFQGLCVLGYCIAPLNIAAFVSCFVHIIYVRAPIALLAWAWCIWGVYPQAISVDRN